MTTTTTTKVYNRGSTLWLEHVGSRASRRAVERVQYALHLTRAAAAAAAPPPAAAAEDAPTANAASATKKCLTDTLQATWECVDFPGLTRLESVAKRVPSATAAAEAKRSAFGGGGWVGGGGGRSTALTTALKDLEDLPAALFAESYPMAAETGAGFVLLRSLPPFSVADESKAVRSSGSYSSYGYDDNIHIAETQFAAAAPHWASTLTVTALLFAIGEVLPLVEVAACGGDVARATAALQAAVQTMSKVSKATTTSVVADEDSSTAAPETTAATDGLSAKGATLLTLFTQLRMLLSTVRDAAAGKTGANASGPDFDAPTGDAAEWARFLTEALTELGADAAWTAAAVRASLRLTQNVATAAQDTAHTTKKPYNATTASSKELDTFAADVLETVWLNSVPALYDAAVRLLLQGVGLAAPTGAFAPATTSAVEVAVPRLALSEAAGKAHAQLHQLKRSFIQSLVLSDSERDKVLTSAFTQGDGVASTAVHGAHWVLDALPFPLMIADSAMGERPVLPATGSTTGGDDPSDAKAAAAAARDLVSKHDAAVRAGLRAALLRVLPRLPAYPPCPTAGDAAALVRPSSSQFGLAEGLALEQQPDTVVFPVPRAVVTRLLAALAPSASASDATALPRDVAIAGLELESYASAAAAAQVEAARRVADEADAKAAAAAAALVSPVSTDGTVSPGQTDAAIATGTNTNTNEDLYDFGADFIARGLKSKSAQSPLAGGALNDLKGKATGNTVSNALSVIPYLGRANILLHKFVLSNLDAAEKTATGAPLYLPRVALQLLNQVFTGAAFVPLHCGLSGDCSGELGKEAPTKDPLSIIVPWQLAVRVPDPTDNTSYTPSSIVFRLKVTSNGLSLRDAIVAALRNTQTAERTSRYAKELPDVQVLYQQAAEHWLARLARHDPLTTPLVEVRRQSSEYAGEGDRVVTRLTEDAKAGGFITSHGTNTTGDNVIVRLCTPAAPGDRASIPGKCGLDNLGNTCYMNASLQCIAHVRPFRERMLQVAEADVLHAQSPTQSLTLAMRDLMAQMFSGDNSRVAPRDLKAAVGKRFRRFDGYDQQDANEFIVAFLDGILEELNPIKKRVYRMRTDADLAIPDAELSQLYWVDYKRNNLTFVFDTWFGQLRSDVQCLECGYVSIIFDAFSCLPISLTETETVPFHPVIIYDGAPTTTAATQDAAEQKERVQRHLRMRVRVSKGASVRDLQIAIWEAIHQDPVLQHDLDAATPASPLVGAGAPAALTPAKGTAQQAEPFPTVESIVLLVGANNSSYINVPPPTSRVHAGDTIMVFVSRSVEAARKAIAQHAAATEKFKDAEAKWLKAQQGADAATSAVTSPATGGDALTPAVVSPVATERPVAPGPAPKYILLQVGVTNAPAATAKSGEATYHTVVCVPADATRADVAVAALRAVGDVLRQRGAPAPIWPEADGPVEANDARDVAFRESAHEWLTQGHVTVLDEQFSSYRSEKAMPLLIRESAAATPATGTTAPVSPAADGAVAPLSMDSNNDCGAPADCAAPAAATVASPAAPAAIASPVFREGLSQWRLLDGGMERIVIAFDPAHFELLVEGETEPTSESNMAHISTNLYDTTYGTNMPAKPPATRALIVEHSTMQTVPGPEYRPPPATVESCVYSAAQPQDMKGMDQYYCPKCKEHRDARKTESITVLPPVLVVQLKRFCASADGMSMRKIGTSVPYGPVLDLTPMVNKHSVVVPVVDGVDAATPGSTTPGALGRGTSMIAATASTSLAQHPLYRLVGVVHHSGSLSYGHYTASVLLEQEAATAAAPAAASAAAAAAAPVTSTTAATGDAGAAGSTPSYFEDVDALVARVQAQLEAYRLSKEQRGKKGAPVERVWYECNDGSVYKASTPFPVDPVTAYVLFYERMTEEECAAYDRAQASAATATAASAGSVPRVQEIQEGVHSRANELD